MLGRNTVKPFKRETFIKDLFRATQVIDIFDIIEFESLKGFINSIKEGFFEITKEKTIKINIDTIDNFLKMKEIIKKTDLGSSNTLILRIPLKIVVECMENFAGIDKLKFQISIIDDDGELTLSEVCATLEAKQWAKENPIWMYIHINKDNFINKFTKIPYYYVNGRLRFFKLDFDYESLMEMTLKELAALEFWIYHLDSWSGQGKGSDVIIIDDFRDLIKPIFVADDFKIYLNKEHKDKEPETTLCDLIKQKDKNGEDMSYKEIIKLRKYIDITEKFIFQDFRPSKTNFKLINWYQNLKINGELVEVPHITTMIMNWIGLRRER